MQELNTTVILQKASPGRGTLWNKFYAYNQIMPQQHEAIVSSLRTVAHNRLQRVHGRKPGKEAVPLRAGTFPPWVVTGAV